MTATTGDVLFVSRQGRRAFRNPVEVIAAQRVADVRPALKQIEEAVARGLHAAGFLAFEAAPAFDPVFAAHTTGGLPLLWFGLYENEIETQPSAGTHDVGLWRPLVSEENYLRSVHGIRELIAAGDTYQVNYTFPMEARFEGGALPWFERLCAAQRADHCAYVDTGRFQLLSASPELFFRLDGEHLETRPMKGTRRRGRWLAEDRELAAELAASEKDQAENVMIVDLLRNDISRVAQTGSVHVPRLFDVERYQTVWQMTSTVAARTAAGVPEILAALFPCGSVTGAPKVRTMEIIREYEPFPRGVYCGSIGWWSPGRQAEFNVAIRTVTVDRETQTARYNVGGGITWGSTPEGEYEECLVKASVLRRETPSFELLESLLYDDGLFLLDEHMQRLADSAEYFGYAADCAAIEKALRDATADLGSGRHKVRLLVAQDGTYRIECAPAAPVVPVRVGFAAAPVDSRNVFLYHKTTHRDVYAQAKASRPDCDDVLLWNERGEITESTTANVVLDLEGKLLTPPVSSGLLGGTLRARLLRAGEIAEAVLTKEDVRRARSVRLINSVRKWIDVEFVNS